MKKVISGLEAILFDMDGTLVTSTAAVERAWSRWALKNGLDVEHVLHSIHGKPARESIRTLAPQLDLPAEERWLLQAELEEHEGISAISGAKQLLLSLGNFPWAIVTSADRSLAIHRLKLAGIELPEVIVTIDDVTKGKPDPECYLLAASKLAVDPSRCLVVEDTVAGLEAGRRAGMQVLGITTSLSASQLGCVNTVTDYAEVLFEKSSFSLKW